MRFVVILIAFPVHSTDSIVRNLPYENCFHDIWLVVKSNTPSAPGFFKLQGLQFNDDFNAAVVQPLNELRILAARVFQPRQNPWLN